MASMRYSSWPTVAITITWSASIPAMSSNSSITTSKICRKRSSRATATNWSITIWCSTYARKPSDNGFVMASAKKGDPRVAFFMRESRSGLGDADHLPFMGQGLFCQVDPVQYASDLLDAFVVLQGGVGRMGFVVPPGLVHEQVMVTLGGDLRKVSDGQDLAALAEAPQQLADHFGGRTADAHIDFIEYEGRYARGLCGDYLDRQADARELAA